MREYDRRRADELKADRLLFEAAAAELRRGVALDRVAGLSERPEVCFTVAAVFDTFALAVADLPGLVRGQARQTATVVLGGRLA